jgi:glutathione S-transferase
MIKLWGRRNSLNVQKVLWLLDELGLAYERIDAGGPFGGLASPEFATLNPNRLVPVLEDEGEAVWESHAILRYLAARYGAPALWPDDSMHRSHSDRWMDWCLTTWQPVFLAGIFWAYYRTPEADRDLVEIGKNVARSGQLMTLLDAALEARGHLCGDAFSLGEIPLGASLYRYFELDIHRPATPHVDAWYARLQERPAYRAHVMTAFDDLKGRLSF